MKERVGLFVAYGLVFLAVMFVFSGSVGAIPPGLFVDIDIKPGSDPNCINADGNGVIPVAILGTADFDATQVDPYTLTLEGLPVKAVGKSEKLLAHYEDVNGDGFLDLVVQFEDVYGSLSGLDLAFLQGLLFDGIPIAGADTICLVPAP